MKRILALDLGGKRIGVAVTDPTQTIAQVLDPWPADKLLSNLQFYLSREPCEKILVGLPVSMDGKEHAQAERIRRAAALLNEQLEIPIEFCDERLTSVQAGNMLKGMGVKNLKGKKDSLAASLLLEAYLQKNNK